MTAREPAPSSEQTHDLDRGKAPLRPYGTARPARAPSASTPRRRGLSRVGPVLAAVALLASGCTADQRDRWERGGLPEGATNHTDRIITLWQGAWVAALLAGALVWGLIVFAIVRFRRRATDTGLPPQVRYNVPVEALYTTVPLIVVLVFFYFTARDEREIVNVAEQTDRTVNVVGKRWSWDFNYYDDNGEPYAYDTGTPGEPPTLYLPVGESVRFVLNSRDVAHSFWVPNFLFKMDLFPGRTNQFEATPTETGVFAGKCAELCGIDHSRMLFNVAVVTPEDYEAHLDDLRDRGQTGELPAELGPDQSASQDGPSTMEGAT